MAEVFSTGGWLGCCQDVDEANDEVVDKVIGEVVGKFVGKFVDMIVDRIALLSDGVDWDSGGESGHGAQARRDIETKCLSPLEPSIPIHLHCPDPPRLTVIHFQSY